MGSILGGKAAKPPPLPKPEPPPIVEEAGVEEAERKRLRKRRGREETFLTGELIPEPTKKTALG